MENLDSFDISLLRELQRDSAQSANTLSEKVCLSASQTHRRIKRLEGMGIIKGYVAQLDPACLDLNIHAIVTIKVHQDTPQMKKQLREFVNLHDEVTECWTVVGEKYAMLRVVTTTMSAFSHFISDELMALNNIASSESILFMEPIKVSTVLPVPRC